MARLIGPDQSERVFFATVGTKKGTIVPAGTAVPLYADPACTLPADVLTPHDTTFPGPIPTVYIDNNLEVPLFKFPDVTDPVVYTTVLGGPVVELHPRSDDRIDALRDAITSLGSTVGSAAQKSANLSDLTDTTIARTNLGLGGAATRDVGTTAGTVAAGDDSRIVDAVQASRTIATNGALSGGGNLGSNLTLSVQAASTSQPGVVQLGTNSGQAVPGNYVPYDVRWSGVVGDGVTDDSAALTAAVAVCSGASKRVLYVAPELNVLIASQVNMQFVRRIDCKGTITVAYAGGPGLIVGDSSAQRNSCRYEFARVVWAGSQSNVALRFVGLKNGYATVEYCDYMQLWADGSIVAQSSIAYSTFHLGRVRKLELYGAAGTSWINENNFYGGSIDNLIIDAVSYAHNGNVWHNCSIEGSTSTIQILIGSCNRISARGELGPHITFGANTWNNEVIGTYTSTPGARATPMVVDSDLGSDNIVSSAIDLKSSYRELMKIDQHSVLYNASSEWPAVAVPVPGLRKLRVRTVGGIVLDTGQVPIRGVYPLTGSVNYYRNWSMLRVNIDSDATLWRPSIYAYNATGDLIDPAVSPWMLTTGGWTVSAGSYTFGTNVSLAQITIIDPNVSYLRIVVAAGVAGSFSYLRLSGYVNRPQPDTAIQQVRRALRRPLYQSAAPTEGAAQLGTIVAGPSSQWQCINRADTTLTAPASSGATSITVASASGITGSDIIGVLLDDDTTHWTTVSGPPSGTTVNLTVGLPSAAASGRAVVTTRWATVGGSSSGAAALGCAPGYWLVTGTAYGTSATFSANQMMAIPVYIPRQGVVGAIGAEFTVASSEATTPALRLGLYADDGNGRPGSLVIDGGTVSVASGTTPGQVSVTTSANVTAGWYWLTVAIQGVTSNFPTMRIVTAANPVAVSAPIQSTSALKMAYLQSGVSGALPASWSSWSASGGMPKMMLQLN